MYNNALGQFWDAFPNEDAYAFFSDYVQQQESIIESRLEGFAIETVEGINLQIHELQGDLEDAMVFGFEVAEP